MKEIPLTQGKVAIVDDEDYEWLSKWKWCALKRVLKRGIQWYAIRQEAKCSFREKARMVIMHREILGLSETKIFGDHKNHNGLDNRRENLRSATPKQNAGNTRKRPGGTSRFKGVSWCRTYEQWCVKVGSKFIGRYDTEEEAGKASEEAHKARYGEYACFGPT